MKLWEAGVRLYWPAGSGKEGSVAWGAVAHAETASAAAALIREEALYGEVEGARAEVFDLKETTDGAFLLD